MTGEEWWTIKVLSDGGMTGPTRVPGRRLTSLGVRQEIGRSIMKYNVGNQGVWSVTRRVPVHGPQ